jgi:hypothetical protein
MASTQQFAGNFRSQLHQFNGNHFYGPVSITASDSKDGRNLIAVQDDSRRKGMERSRGEVDEQSKSSLSEDLSWDG